MTEQDQILTAEQLWDALADVAAPEYLQDSADRVRIHSSHEALRARAEQAERALREIADGSLGIFSNEEHARAALGEQDTAAEPTRCEVARDLLTQILGEQDTATEPDRCPTCGSDDFDGDGDERYSWGADYCFWP